VTERKQLKDMDIELRGTVDSQPGIMEPGYIPKEYNATHQKGQHDFSKDTNTW
jgi:hypothetical protein